MKYLPQLKYHISIFAPVFLPMLIVGVVLLIATHIIYGTISFKPKNQRSPASAFQEALIENHLRLAGKRDTEDSQIITISLKKSDFSNIKTESNGLLKNATISEYIKLIEKINLFDTQHVIVNWFPVTNPSLEEVSRLKSIFKRYPNRYSLYTGPATEEYLKETFGSVAHVKRSEFCAGGYYSICPFKKEWTFWSIVDLHTKFSSPIPKSALSKNLSKSFDVFLLNLGDLNKTSDYSFTEAIYSDELVKSRSFDNKIIFIGADIIQGVNGMTDPVEIDKINTPHSNHSKASRVSGVPIHKFWAQIAKMFIDDAYISIASKELIYSIIIIFCILSLLSSIFWGPFSGLLVYFSGFILGNLANVISIHKFNFYTPVFSAFYFSAIFFILGGFLRLIIEFIRNKFTIEKEKTLTASADLKSNFISLISHNLNTPVAKMISLLELSKVHLSNKSSLKTIGSSLNNASQIQLSVRSVLATNRLEEDRLLMELVTSKTLLDEINYEVVPMFARMGINLGVEDESENEDVRFQSDRRLIISIVSAISYLLSSNNLNHPQQMLLTLNFNYEKMLLNLEWNTTTEPIILSIDSISGFLEESTRALYHTFLKKSSSNMQITKEDENGYNLNLEINCN